jgi:anti-sigma regulatory factor (Ser/Thr protein kinase)
MTAEPSRVELLVPADDRLTVAVDVVVANAAERAGLSSQEQKQLIRATAEACDETFSLSRRNGRSDPRVHVAVSDFPNRVEVSVEQSDDGPLAPPAEMASLSARQSDPLTAALHHINVDRLHHEIHEGRFRTTLVKYHAAAKPQGKF